MSFARSVSQFQWVTSVLVFASLHCLAFGAPAFATLPDPGVADPNTPVTRVEYTYGNQAFVPTELIGTGRAVEVTASVHYPANLEGGPFPLVAIVHGGFNTCGPGVFDLSTGLGNPWPCPPNTEITPSYVGYDYIAEVLASHGFIVVSISANGVNAAIFDLSGSTGGDRLARAELLQHHLDLWSTFTTNVEPIFQGLFVGKVDLDRVGTMGHSLGGSAVLRHVELSRDLGSPQNVRSVLTIAPMRGDVVNGVHLASILPNCDGQIKTFDGVLSFDRARYNDPSDPSSRHTLHVGGANHNYFNTIWNEDDWAGGFGGLGPNVYAAAENKECSFSQPTNGRLDQSAQESVGRAYATAFFRRYLKGEESLAPYLNGEASPPPSVATDRVYPSYHAPWTERLDINPMLDDSALVTNALGGSVSETGLSAGTFEICGATGLCEAHTDTLKNFREPHHGTEELAGVGQTRLSWDGTASYTNAIPVSASDFRAYLALQFRVSVDYKDARNPVGLGQDFDIVLVDADANEASVPASYHSDALFFPPGLPESFYASIFHPVPRLVLNGVRIPLSAFTGVDLARITAVRFDFEDTGTVFVSDLALADSNPIDSDSDGVVDYQDNCVTLANPSQLDADLDGFGNRCDGDLTQTGVVTGTDYNAFLQCFGQTAPTPGVGPDPEDPDCGESDIDGDGLVAGADFGAFSALFGTAPGPSGLVCADSSGATAPCEVP
jgi:hypothetical protein